jgi:choline dehydrogenase-like flavoprotein
MGAAYFEDHGREEFDGHAMVIGPVLVSPESRGSVRLRSADPLDKPRILTNSLATQSDVDSLIAGIELAREIAAKPPLSDVIVRELKPGPDVTDRDALAAAVRERLFLHYHPSGTCRMSDDAEGAVVDSQLRVHGIEALRVVDASVFPLIPGGNTNAPTIMVAERAADLIRGRQPLA